MGAHMRALRLTALALIALFAAATVAEAATYRIPKVHNDDIKRIAPRADIAIRIPTRMNLDYAKGVYGEGSGSNNRYTF